MAAPRSKGPGPKRTWRWTLLILTSSAVAGGAIIARPIIFLAQVWASDQAKPLPDPKAGENDFSRLEENAPKEVIAISTDQRVAEEQVASLILRAKTQSLHISISGARHSMGGHTLYPGAVVLDMLPFNRMSLDSEGRLLTVGAGARWADVVSFLDHQGLAVAVMQSNNDFTVGGSLSVNCHGWQHNSRPIASTVDSFRLATASGKIITCSRSENQELFTLVLGGYGLFGVILEVQLRVVPNEFYRAERHRVKTTEYARIYHELTSGKPEIGMAYGRISVAPASFLEDAQIVLFKQQSTVNSVRDTLRKGSPSLLKRLIFRGSVGSDYGKNLRWWLETQFGESGNQILSRNEIMNAPSDWYADRDPQSAEILHEYFIPTSRLGQFLDKMRPICLRDKPDLLNITVRNVEPDEDTFLRYANEEVFGLVMLFHQGRDEKAEAAMQNLTRELVDAALACGGSYYLPYRPHATLQQFQKAYPQARKFFLLKRQYDPTEIFENQFYVHYGRP
jgi:FAD/FMN-containing dehydrogenase